MSKPNLFIVGAPRCGTTALFTYLGQHPQIFVNERAKEVHYFGSDLHHIGPRRLQFSEKEYIALFKRAADELWVGEASTSYLYSKNAPQEIRKFSPSARIIIMLRQPIEMMYSLHGLNLFTGAETLVDLEAALNAEDERHAGRSLPAPPYLLESMFYREIARFTDHVSRYFDVFGRRNVHVIIFDDFVTDTARVYRETLEFLDVDTDFRPSFEPVNSHMNVRSKYLRRLLRRPPAPMRWITQALPPSFLLARFAGRLRRLNTTHGIRPPMDPNLRRRLEIEFRPEIERLSGLLGRDLAAWR